jgi:hypothetical protein
MTLKRKLEKNDKMIFKFNKTKKSVIIERLYNDDDNDAIG